MDATNSTRGAALRLDTEAVERRLGAMLAQLRVRVFPEPIGRGPRPSSRPS